MRMLFLLMCLLTAFCSSGQVIPNYVPTDSLVGWWPFSGNANDISGNGHNGTNSGATLTSDRFNSPNNAYHFVGRDQSGNSKITIPHASVFNDTAFTISLWFKKDNSTIPSTPNLLLDGEWLISKCPYVGGGQNVRQFEISVDNNVQNTLTEPFWIVSGVSDNSNSAMYKVRSDSIFSGNWYFIVITKSYNNLKLYVNGIKEVDSLINDSFYTNTSDFLIGQYWGYTVPTGTITRDFTGTIDDVGMWNRVLTDCEIQNLYSGSLSNCEQGTSSDTTVCLGDTISLGTSVSPTPLCTNGIGEWEQIFSSTDLNGYTITRNSSYSFDTVNGIYYSVNNGAITALDLVNKTINSVTSTGGSSSISNAVYNYSDGKLYGHRVGRDVVYSISTSGGAWTSVGTGSFDGNSYSSLEFYNSHDERIGFFGGYGYYAVKNWVYESTASGWINSFANNSNCNSTSVPSKRNAGGIAPNKDFKKMYLYSGMGNCSGSQTATTCTLGNAWATDVGVYCWLKDLWEYDFVTDQFTNILSYNNSSIPLEGEFTYDYNRDIFYLLGGWTPSPTYQSGYGNTALNSNMVFRYDRGNNAGGFDTVTICGTPPPIGTINQTSGIGIFDSPRDRILWLRTDGVWAINFSNSSSTSSTSSFLWSTGDTTSTINVSPSTTTKYWVRQIAGTDTIVDTITVNVLNPTINASTNSICNPGDSVMLWTSKDSSVTQSCGGMPASLQNGLMAYYPFCGNANDLSGFGNQGTVLNAALANDRNGNPQSAYYFDGSSKITVPSSAQISDSLNSQVTFSAWINVESYPNGFGPILSKNGQITRQFEVWVESDKLGFWSTQIYGSATTTVPYNTWLHYVVTFDQGTVKYYLNSTLIQTSSYTTTSLAGNNSVFEIGHDSPGVLELFKGFIDDVAIWNRVLSPTDVANLYSHSTNYSNTLWSTGETTDTIWINPTTDTTIWVSSTLGNVTCVDSIDIEVNNCLTITESDTTICLGDTLSLSANLNLQAGCLMNISYTGIPPGDPIPGFTYGGLYNGHYYYVYDTPTSWTQGEQLCRQNGGYLVCIDDINENTFVSNLVPSFSNKNIWIGLYRDSTTCQFRWLNCINIAYTNWRPGEPNSGPCGEPYAQIIRGCSYGLNTWNNLGNNASNGSCYSNMVPILEIDPTIGSTASTSILWSTGDTTNTINVSPTSTTKYWVRKTIDSDTIIDTITVHVLDPTINATSTTVCSASDSVMLWINSDSTSTPSACGDLPSGLNNGLVAWYPFCGNANDESTYSNNGTIYGASLTSDRFGNMNSAYDFDGDDWIQVPHNSQIDFSLSDDYTVSCWVSATSSNSNGSIYEKWDNSFLPYPFVLRTVSNSDVIVNRYTGGWPQNQSNNHSTSFSSNLLTTGSYDHIVNVFTPDTMFLYLNGVLMDSEVNPMTTGGSINNTHPLYIGRRGARTDRFYTGKIDDLGIWNRALTQSEITQLYNGSNSSSTLWSTGETTDTIWINPTTDTTIWVSSTRGNVTCVDSIDIDFLNPEIQSNTLGVCAPGDTAMLWVENESHSVTWSTGETSDTIFVTPAVATSYWVQFTSFNGVCSDTVEIDVSEPIEIFGDSIVCKGDSLLLYTIPTQTFNYQEVPDSLMYQVTKTFGQNWQVDWSVSSTDWYLLEVSGLWNFTSCSNHRDAAFWTNVSCLANNLNMTPYVMNCAGGNASWWLDDSCNQRPINDVYSNNHVYTYKVRANDGSLTLKFYDDQHSDNGGSLTFKLFSIADSSIATSSPVIWSTGETTDSIWVKPTQTTTYWASSTDQYGCESTDSITVFVSDIQNSISTQEPSCNGSSDGQAQVNPTGGVSPYTFLWSNGSGSSIANNLSSDTVWVAVTDSIGCSAVDTFFLDQPDSLLITSILTSSYNGYNVSCNGGSDGNVNTTVAGGTMPYYYNWNNNTYTTSGISNVSAGTYILQVTDTNGCMVSQTVLLSEPNPIVISPSITSNFNGYAVSCYGESDGSADVNISGGISPYTILWSNGTPTSSMTNVPSGSYSVMITDGNGCIDSTQIYLSQPNPLSATAIVTDASCYGERNGRIELSLSGGAGSFNINWNTGDTGITIDNIPSDWYSYNVISSNNCSYEDSIFLDHPMPLSIELDTIHPTCINSFDGELNLVAMGGTPGYNYFLNGNAFTGSIQGLGTDSLRILAVDFNNCDTLFVIAMPPVRDPCIFIPNWFSPNGNSEEDTWLIDGFEYGALTLKIFNVLGQELYRTESANYIPWDGTFSGKSLPAGDYYYVITSALLNNNYTGYVTLLR